jgi:hypothetical protein
MATARSRWLVAAAGMAMIGAGCGSSAHPAHTSTRSTTAPAAADPTAVAVIRGWSDALRRGDVDAAARYFALPSEFFNGADDAIAIDTEAQARAANATLPCGAVLLSTMRRGRFVTALFRLTNRPGPDGGCGSGTGQLASTDFIIAHGRITYWIRAPQTGPGGTSPLPPAPTSTQGTGPTV